VNYATDKADVTEGFPSKIEHYATSRCSQKFGRTLPVERGAFATKRWKITWMDGPSLSFFTFEGTTNSALVLALATP
jgi:hypothetical protein